MSDRASRIPKYRHYRPKDLAVVRIDGRDVYLGKHGSPESREKYHRVVAEWLAGSPHPAPIASAEAIAPIIINDLILGFWRHAQSYYRRADGMATREADNYKDSLRPLRKLYGSTPARDFGPLALKAVRQEMIDVGLCRQTINHRVGRIVRVFKWGVENELIPPSVHQALKAVRGLAKGRSEVREGRVVKPAPEADVEAIRPHVTRQVWAMVELQRLTGMRSGEATAMRTGDIDRSGPVWTYTPGSHKTAHRGKDRTIYLGPRAQEVLKPWLRPELDAYLFQPGEAMAEFRTSQRSARKTPLYPSQQARTRNARPKKTPGVRYRAQTYAHSIERACKRAGVPHWHPHQLRHHAATWLRKEFGLDVARIVLGHTSPAVTETYAEADREKAIHVMGKVG